MTPLTGHCGSMRVACLNVGTLSGRLTWVLNKMKDEDIQVLCLQETRLTPNNVPAMARAVEKAGLHALFSPSSLDALGHAYGGVAVLSTHPIGELQGTGLPRERFMVALLHRHGARPLRVVSVYLPADNPQNRRDTWQHARQWLATQRDDVVMLGDWNSELHDDPLSSSLVSGQVRSVHIEFAFPCPPTRYNGKRHIDFAVYVGDLHFVDWKLADGCADHLLPIYSLYMPSSPSSRTCWAKQRPITVSDPDLVKARFAEKWSEMKWQYLRDAQDVEAMWRFLSEVAEATLCGNERGGGDPRHLPRRCVQRQNGSTHAKSYQTLRHRQLLRVQRLLREWQRHPSEHLAGILRRRWLHLARAVPELDADAPVQEWDRLLERAISNQMSRDQQDRLYFWTERMHTDLAAKRRWIKMQHRQALLGEHDDPDFQVQAEHALSKLSELWGASAAPWTPTPPVEAWVRQMHAPCPVPHVSGAGLLALARKQVDKAAGCDGWSARDLIRLPVCWWDACACVWNVMINSALIPSPWWDARVVLIPKNGSTERRPLTIFSLLWRLGQTIVAQYLSDWALLWAPKEMCGALRHRSIDDAHLTFTEALAQATEARECILGAKLDLSKAFDRVPWDISLWLLQQLGLPQCIASLWRQFDHVQRRWPEVCGCVSRTPILPQGSLPQGDPCSPLRLSVMMAVWMHLSKLRCPDLSASIYVDDRLVWVRARHFAVAMEKLRAVLDENAVIESALAMRDNPAKRVFFANSPRDAAQLRKHCAPVVVEAEVLGITYNFYKGHPIPFHKNKAWNEAMRRLHRVHIAGGPPRERGLLVRSLVLSLFCWAGAWTFLPLGRTKDLQRKLELAIYPNIRGRNRFLALACLGADLDISIQMLKGAIRIATRCLVEAEQQNCQSVTLPERILDICTHHGWTLTHEGHLYSDHGNLQLGVDGPSAIAQALARHRTLQLLSEDEALKNASGQHAEIFPIVDSHVHLLGNQCHGWRARARVALGRPLDARGLGYMLKRPPEAITCMCNLEGPVTEHLAWQCPLRPHTTNSNEGRSALEQRYLLPLLPRPALPPPRTDLDGRCQSLAEKLRSWHDPCPHTVLLATDGGALPGAASHPGRAAWGVVVYSCDVGDSVIDHDLLQGEDASPGCAELWALQIACLALGQYQVRRCTFLCDNRNVVNTFSALLDGRVRDISLFVMHMAHPICWVRIWNALRSVDCSHWSVQWVPSHGKHPEWIAQPPSSGALYRELNALADNAATDSLAHVSSTQRAWHAQVRDAKGWSAIALNNLVSGSRALGERYAEDLRQHRA